MWKEQEELESLCGQWRSVSLFYCNFNFNYLKSNVLPPGTLREVFKKGMWDDDALIITYWDVPTILTNNWVTIFSAVKIEKATWFLCHMFGSLRQDRGMDGWIIRNVHSVCLHDFNNYQPLICWWFCSFISDRIYGRQSSTKAQDLKAVFTV